MPLVLIPTPEHRCQLVRSSELVSPIQPLPPAQSMAWDEQVFTVLLPAKIGHGPVWFLPQTQHLLAGGVGDTVSGTGPIPQDQEDCASLGVRVDQNTPFPLLPNLNPEPAAHWLISISALLLGNPGDPFSSSWDTCSPEETDHKGKDRILAQLCKKLLSLDRENPEVDLGKWSYRDHSLLRELTRVWK